MRLPRLTIVATFLTMTDRSTERYSVFMSNREQRDFIIELNESFDDHTAATSSTTFLCISPRRIDITRALHNTLSFSRRAHDGLNNTWDPDLFDALFKLCFCS